MKPAKPVRVDFFYPLTVLVDDLESGKIVDTDNALLVGQEQNILSEIECMVICFDKRDMTEYFTLNDFSDDFGAKEKLLSSKWSLENMGGVVYRRVSVEVKVPLTVAEKEDTANWIHNENQIGIPGVSTHASLLPISMRFK